MRSPHSLFALEPIGFPMTRAKRRVRRAEPRLRVNCVQIEQATGQFVVLEEVLTDRVAVTVLAPHSTIGMPMLREEWLSDRFRTPTSREYAAYRRGMSLLNLT